MSEVPARRRVPRRDDGPLPTPLLVDADLGLWQAGYRDWDADGREYRVDGEMFEDRRAAWARSQAMVAAERQRRGP